jgi:xanthine dehydrogenase accessory factor
MKNQTVFRHILSELEAGRPAVLIVIAETKGSSAGKAGFKCAAGKDKVVGTIGGGTAEHRLVKEAKEILSIGERIQRLRIMAHNPKSKAEKSGMICSGQQSTILCKIDQEDTETIRAILRAEELKDKPGIMNISENKIEFLKNRKQKRRIIFRQDSEEQYLYSEQIGLPDTLYIIGGGHVGAAVADIFSKLNFYIKIFDHRKELKIFQDITTAHEKTVIEYKSLWQHLQPDESKYILIMTADHASDQVALGQAVKSNARYIGMLGSKAKIAAIFKNLEAKGIKRELLEKINTPAGMPIASNTPYEIAVSIAAKIIDIRNTEPEL